LSHLQTAPMQRHDSVATFAATGRDDS